MKRTIAVLMFAGLFTIVSGAAALFSYFTGIGENVLGIIWFPITVVHSSWGGELPGNDWFWFFCCGLLYALTGSFIYEKLAKRKQQISLFGSGKEL